MSVLSLGNITLAAGKVNHQVHHTTLKRFDYFPITACPGVVYRCGMVHPTDQSKQHLAVMHICVYVCVWTR